MKDDTRYTTEKIESIASKLRNMPQPDRSKQKHSKQEAIKILSKEVSVLQKRGYTLEQISEILRGEGLEISTPTLKSYLQRARPSKKAPVRKQEDTHKPTQEIDKLVSKSKQHVGKSEASVTPKQDTKDI